MFRVTINNEINRKNYRNIEFSKKEIVRNAEVDCVNLVYACNGIGKSTTAQIMHSYFDDDYNIVNHFDNELVSNMLVQQDDYNILNAFRYDRSFAINSVGTYEGKLIISPDSAKEFSAIETKLESYRLDLLSKYKKTGVFKDKILSEYKDLLKKTSLEKFALKTLNKNHSKNLYVELERIISLDVDCNEMGVRELVEFGALFDIQFYNELKKIKQVVDSEIFINFPEVSTTDYEIYEKILEYFETIDDFIDIRCLMCGETILTEELVKRRIEKIQSIIANYVHSEKGNILLSATNNFLTTRFSLPILKEVQRITRTINQQNVVQKAIEILSIIESYDVNVIHKNYQDCILKLILSKQDIISTVILIKDTQKKFNDMVKKNKSTINEDVKSKFIKNLSSLGFKYSKDTLVEIDTKTSGLTMSVSNINLIELYNAVLSESEKTLLSLSLFLAISSWDDKTLILIDDPVDSHDEKTKWFIVNQIFEYYKNSDVLLIIFTHDLSLSKTINSITRIPQRCYIMHDSSIRRISAPSLYFESIYNYIYSVEGKIDRFSENAKYFIPLAFMMRYLSKNQKKLYKEFMDPLPVGSISRNDVNDIGFESISNLFVHYSNRLDSLSLLMEINKYMRISFNDVTLPTYFNGSISSEDLITNLIADIGDTDQFQLEISTILYALLIRNILEKKFLNGSSRVGRYLGQIAEDYKTVNGSDSLYLFYRLNKTLVDDFAHIESGTDVLLTYSYDEILTKYGEIKAL